MTLKNLYIDKELSWLSFNERVLQEAADKSVPLIERIRFLGIFSSNLDEFYKVRFADVKRRILIRQEQDSAKEAKKLLTKMQKRVVKLNEKFNDLYNDLILEMARRRIFLVKETQLDERQQKWILQFFRKQILPHLMPLMLSDKVNVLEFLKDESAYFAIRIKNKDNLNYALLEIPMDKLPRFIVIPEEKGSRRKTLILLDNVIRFCLDEIFRGFFEYDKLSCYAMLMTRDAEYDLINELDHSLVEQLSEGLSQRLTAMPVRLVYEEGMPQKMLDYMSNTLKVSDYDDLLVGGRYLSFKDFIDFPNVGPKYLENKPLPPVTCADFDNYDNAFDAIMTKDILLYYPYHTFDHITELVRQASFDPKVRRIKINVYRVAKNSKLMKSLIDAAHAGKKVTVIVELQARFDEEANIEWSKKLKDADIKVLFGAPGMKIHAKLLLIYRKEKDETTLYAHVGTGNFHEKTAQIYTDFALLTANPKITREVHKVFEYIENPYSPINFKYLIVSPRNSRVRLYRFIERETSHALEGKKAGLTIKINNLVDPGVIDKLYEASNAGVKIKMIIRGMCSLVPGVKGLSDNIEIISIIDRFLEHPRLFISENDGEPQVYISSADWMNRNIENRIEVAVPIFDKRLISRIRDIVNIHFTDTMKARRINQTQSNSYVARGNRKKIRSQIAIYDYIKQVEKQTRKQNKAAQNKLDDSSI